MAAILVSLAVLGLVFGSFISALTWRIHEKKDWVRGRSQCPRCGHRLATADLIPFFSWLFLSGRCRYCKKPISWQYPAIELATAAVFAGSYYFWPGGVQGAGDWVLFTTWLAVSVGLLALLLYDARWMLLPNKILYPTFLVAATGRLIYVIGFEEAKLQAVGQWLLAVLVASGIFWLLFMVSSGRWIGFGDVRLGLILGTVLASPSLSLLMIFIASLLGTIFALPAILTGQKKLASRIPYGPFLIVSTAVCLLFGSSAVDWYKELLLL